MLPNQFGVYWLLGLGVEAKNRFSRWLPWRPSWNLDRHDFLAIFDLQVTLMLPSKFGVKWPFGSGEEAKKIFKMAAMVAILDFRSERFSYFFYLHFTLMLPTKYRDHFLARFRDILAFFCKKSHPNSRSEKTNRTLNFSHLSSYLHMRFISRLSDCSV